MSAATDARRFIHELVSCGVPQDVVLEFVGFADEWAGVHPIELQHLIPPETDFPSAGHR